MERARECETKVGQLFVDGATKERGLGTRRAGDGPGAGEQDEAGGDDLLDGIHGGRKELVRNNFIGMSGESGIQATAPGEANFRIDVDDGDARSDGQEQVGVGCAGSPVEREGNFSFIFDGADALDIEVLLCGAFDHGFEHTVHGADGGRESVHEGLGDEVLRFEGIGQELA